MRVALINAPWYTDEASMWGVRAGSRWPHFQQRPAAGQLPRYIPFPFFLASAAAVLEDAGHSILLCDGVAADLSLEDLIAKLVDFAPDLVFSELSTPSLTWDRTVCAALRKNFPEANLVAGGLLDHVLARTLLDDETIDFWLNGEYEYPLRELAVALPAGGDLTSIAGLMDRSGIDNSPALVSELDDLPAPLYNQLPMHNYSDPVCGLPTPGLQSWLSRGCPFSCSFCVWPQIVYRGHDYRTRSIDVALDEIEMLVQRYGFESFYFDDDTTNIGEARMLELAEKIKKRGLDRLPWGMMARADCMNRTMIDALADAGMYSIKYGVESIATKLIDACGKKTNLPKLIDAIEYSKQRGIKVHLTFTFGLPGETLETIRETTDFAIQIAPETAQFSLCTPFPGTRFFNECLEAGHLAHTDWAHFLGSGEAVVNTPELSTSQLEAGYREALERWSAFRDEQTKDRREKLLDSLRQRIEQGATWSFMGDRVFGAFLFEDNQQISSAYREKDGDIAVIVSAHDEEKIRRQVLAKQSQDVLRLFA
ncbi:hypothetical protein BVY04_00130 [bacterium M21]|nr:hypothetical protein BVY04_00130 [bacterium M21]